MNAKNPDLQKLSRVSRELGTLLRKQAGERWSGLRVARRNERNQHVWRFRTDEEGTERFVRVPHRAMMHGDNATEVLYEQLQAGRWLDRLDAGPETALELGSGGEIRPWTRA
jgi:hypothetical protein